MFEPALPQGFIKQLLPLLGNEADAFFASYQQQPLRGIRFRDERIPLPASVLSGKIPYARNAYYLDSASDAGSMPLHEAGAYYIQEPSAMAAAAVLAPQDGDIVLDLCAAPGGKSTQLAGAARLKLLVANEPIPSRAQVLSRNIERMGIGNAVVTCAYPDALAARWTLFFDKILVDAPCSGEGMFRRHPETRSEWTPDAPKRCHMRQLEILRSAAQMLREGGRMVFSTCTFNSEENEETILAFLAEHPNFELVPIQVKGLPEATNGMLRLWPHRFPGEGHFIALLEKTHDTSHTQRPAAGFLPSPGKAEENAFLSFCSEIGCKAQANAKLGNHLLQAPKTLPPLDHLRVLRVGLQLGELKGKVFLPDHALALTEPIEKRFELDTQNIIRYLHGDTLICPEEKRGYYVVVHHGYQFGFGKANNGQIKNHYPKGLRK